MNLKFEKSLDKLQQIDGVIQEILTTEIPESPERLKAMIIVLNETSCIENNCIRLAI